MTSFVGLGLTLQPWLGLVGLGLASRVYSISLLKYTGITGTDTVGYGRASMPAQAQATVYTSQTPTVVCP